MTNLQRMVLRRLGHGQKAKSRQGGGVGLRFLDSDLASALWIDVNVWLIAEHIRLPVFTEVYDEGHANHHPMVSLELMVAAVS